MSRRASAPLVEGARITPDLTVVGTVNERGKEPVYLVWNHLQWCPMACKVMRSSTKAKHEHKVLSALAHPNVVRCFGVQSNYLLMEFLEGPTLQWLLDSRPRGRLSVSDALRIAIHIGAALSHVHERGFVHLDVKPSNILVTHGRPVLCDFGIARRRREPRPKHIYGTEPYMAPEECSREATSTAADVFGLGVMLFELLTGKLPFADGTKADPYPQVSSTPATVRHHRRAVDVELDRLVLDCLSKDPGLRPELPVLLPALHAFIRRGPTMWPPTLALERLSAEKP